MYPLDIPEYNTTSEKKLKPQTFNPPNIKFNKEKNIKNTGKSVIMENRVGGETEEDIKNKCIDAYNYRSVTPRYKIGRCDLSNNQYLVDETDPNNLNTIYGYSIRSQRFIFDSPLSGMIMCHPDYVYRMKYVEAYKEYLEKISCHHNLQNKILNHKRSSGEIQEIMIDDDCPLKINRNGKICMTIYLEDGLYKNVFLEDVVKTKNGKKNVYTGWISTNKDLFNKEFILKIGFVKLDVDWMNKERESIINEFSKALDNIGSIKYEFYEYESGYTKNK